MFFAAAGHADAFGLHSSRSQTTAPSPPRLFSTRANMDNNTGAPRLPRPSLPTPQPATTTTQVGPLYLSLSRTTERVCVGVQRCKSCES